MNNLGSQLSKLDRILVSRHFMDRWPNSNVLALPHEFSDHTPLLLSLYCDDYDPIPFKMFNSWLAHEDFPNVLNSCWASTTLEVFDGTGHFGLWQSEVLDALFQQGLDIGVEESKPEDVEERNWLTINRLAYDQDLALIVLGSLLEEYELLETTLLNRKDDVSLSEVCVALYSKELKRKDKQISSSGDADVLLVRGKAVAEANVTKCDDEESDLSLVTSSSRNDSEIWQLDSACSHHITPHREWFSNFEEHEEVVYTADETPLTTHGIESKGFEVRAKDGVMKIISGVLVVMKGNASFLPSPAHPMVIENREEL
ncbi:retrovirus-related pol polyprotein from transposon TNT 1-94 [Tanacetum coccineum]